MTDVSVVVPWRGGCPHREAHLEWVLGMYATHHPDWEVVLGSSPDGPFSRAAAILDGATKAAADVLVIADADVWCDSTEAAVRRVDEFGWSVPHRLLHRLSPASTDAYKVVQRLVGVTYQGGCRRDSRPYVGNLAGTLLVVTRDALTEAPPDPRFRGWGQEDDAWSDALHTLVGEPWRGRADLVHLWHPTAQRIDRVRGNDEGMALRRRYRFARGHPERMRALIDEARVAA